jgi:hypothetical protein
MLLKIFGARIWLIFALVLTSCASSRAALTVETSASSVQVNDTVRVSVNAENVTDLTAVEIHLSFDPTLLEVAEVIDGGFIKPDFVVQNKFDNTAGTIDYAVAQINSPPANGSGTILEIVFRAKASGDSPIRFRATQAAPAGALLANTEGIAIEIDLKDGNVEVK